MMCDFHVGQKVVCVDAHNTSCERKRFLGLIPYTRWWSELIEGEVYTVTSVFIGEEFLTGRQDVAVTLAETNQYSVNGFRSGFRAMRFKPVRVQKTDISIFKALLNHQKNRVSA